MNRRHLRLVRSSGGARPTLRTTLELLAARGDAIEPDLIDLLRLAVDDHEPETGDICPSCETGMPCDVWSYAAWESRARLVDDARSLTHVIHARIDARVARGTLREGPRP